MGKTLVYHAGYTKITVPKIIVGKHPKDFGCGFYCTVIREQAQRWAKRFDTPTINVYALLMNEKLNILDFNAMNEEWLDFIANFRAGKTHDRDIVAGAMANDQIYNYVADFIDGIISREQFWSLAKFKYPTHQICFCTPQALKCLRFEYAEEIKP